MTEVDEKKMPSIVFDLMFAQLNSKILFFEGEQTDEERPFQWHITPADVPLLSEVLTIEMEWAKPCIVHPTIFEDTREASAIEKYDCKDRLQRLMMVWCYSAYFEATALP